MYGAAASAIDVDAGPSHSSPASCVITELYPLAAELNSAASAFHADAAACSDSEPGPAYMRAEVASGGNAPRSSTPLSLAGRDRVGGLGSRIRTCADTQ